MTLSSLRIFFLILFFVVSAFVLEGRDIRLINGTILENAKIVNVKEDAILVLHSGGLEQFDRSLVPAGLLKDVEADESAKTQFSSKRKNGDWIEIYTAPNLKESGKLSRYLNFKEIEKIDGWKKVELQVWIKEPTASDSFLKTEEKSKKTESTEPSTHQKRELKEFDVEDLSVVVTAASSQRVEVNWSGKYHFDKNVSRVVDLHAEFLDSYFVPLVITEEQKLYLDGGETVSGSFTASRNTFEMCKYVMFFFGDRREPTDPIKFHSI